MDGFVLSMSISHAVGGGFASWLGHTKDHYNATNCLPALHAGIREGVWQCSVTVKGRIVCRTVNGDMHYNVGCVLRPIDSEVI